MTFSLCADQNDDLVIVRGFGFGKCLSTKQINRTQTQSDDCTNQEISENNANLDDDISISTIQLLHKKNGSKENKPMIIHCDSRQIAREVEIQVRTFHTFKPPQQQQHQESQTNESTNSSSDNANQSKDSIKDETRQKNKNNSSDDAKLSATTTSSNPLAVKSHSESITEFIPPPQIFSFPLSLNELWPHCILDNLIDLYTAHGVDYLNVEDLTLVHNGMKIVTSSAAAATKNDRKDNDDIMFAQVSTLREWKNRKLITKSDILPLYDKSTVATNQNTTTTTTNDDKDESAIFAVVVV
jgi:hypothetical protein